MLSLAIFLPLCAGLGALAVPRGRPDLARSIALGGALATLLVSLLLWAGFAPRGPAQ